MTCMTNETRLNLEFRSSVHTFQVVLITCMTNETKLNLEFREAKSRGSDLTDSKKSYCLFKFAHPLY